MSPAEHQLPDGVFDAIDAGLIVLDADGRVIGWNVWMATASGITASAARGSRLEELFPGHQGSRLMEAVADAIEHGVSRALTHSLHPVLFPLKTRAGRAMIHSVTVRPIGDAPARALIQVTDVTVVTERERALRERQNARYDAVVERAPDPILTLDTEGVIQMANLAAAKEFGYPEAALIGRPLTELLRDRGPWDSAWATLLGGLPLNHPVGLVVCRKDGSPSYLEVSASVWRSNARMFVTAILHDVNERRAAEEALRNLNQTLERRVTERTAELLKAEEALRQSQKMESLGQLTGGIAHDFNNLLTGIVGAMHVLKRRIAAGRYDDVERFMDAAISSANRAAALTHRLLAFARRQPLDRRPLDVNQLIEGVADLLRRTLGERIDLAIDLAEAAWPVLTDANQLENALLNLVINSRDAMPGGGRLTIQTANLSLDRPDQDGVHVIKAGDYTVIGVSDTGIGMSEETLAKVFDPFFTTKPIGQGTGLGLSMIYGFAKQSNGHVRIRSEVGNGTTVKLFLPRYGGAPVPRPAPHAIGEVPHGDGETVLLVEDDGPVRLLISEVLREMGYALLEASNGQEALPVLESDGRLDLMITDVGLPGMNGRQLAEVARQHRPDLKILFVTAYAEHATDRGKFLGPAMDMVTKPFVPEELAFKIREMIASPQP